MTATAKKNTWLALALVYVLLRFGFTAWLDGVNAYASYVLEAFCVAVGALLYGAQPLKNLRLVKQALLAAPAACAAGILAFKGAGLLGATVPFDLSLIETIVFLLVVGPLLEEAIFRFFLWHPIEQITRRPLVALVTTSLIFSYSHLHAIWFTPPEFHFFIMYQAAYTLVLGAVCGFFVYRYRSWSSAVLVHLAFNLGFFIGSRV